MHFKTRTVYSMYVCKHLLQLILMLPWYMGVAVHSVYASAYEINMTFVIDQLIHTIYV